MKKPMLMLIILAIAILSACSAKQEGTACTMDAKICPDGSYVGRQGPDCKFEQCPTREGSGCNYEGTEKKYIGKSEDECSRIRFMCEQSMEAFNDKCGCGCMPRQESGKRYVQNDSEQCKVALFKCENNEEAFFDDSGCGCRPKGDLSNPDEGERHICTPEQKRAEICTMQYDPVCGWFGENIQCIRYPCASTFSNSCQACQSENVAYWTKGKCPA